jgi:hypothetical protein
MNKVLFLILIYIGFIGFGFSQNTVTSYQYWFDNSFSDAVFIDIAEEQSFDLNTNIDASELNNGVHIFYIRFKDNNDMWSSPLAQFIYKLPLQSSGSGNNLICEYQYWFDDNYVDAVNQTITPTSNLELLTNIDVTSINSGVHIFYIRFKDDRGQWSSPMAQFVYKIPEQSAGIENNEIIEYQYWFDNNFAEAETQAVTPTSNLELLTNIDATSINSGVHIFYIRFKDDRGQWSSTVAQFIYKVQGNSILNNKIVKYRYWFDNDIENAQTASVSPGQSFFALAEDIDLTHIWKGEYVIHYQFKDSVGMWSSPTSDTIEKISFPIAEFNYLKTEYCDSTIVEFNNLSIDGDIYLWNFGDGNFSEDSAVVHIYYTHGDYSVSLSITDTLTGVDTTYTDIINIIGHTESYISETVCNYFVAPSGDTLYSSGLYFDTIPNSMFCDSVIQIELAILENTYNTLNVHACDSFIGPSGNIFYSSGIHYDTIPNIAGCDSITQINLDLGQTTSSFISETACNYFESPSGDIYYEDGIYFDTIINSSLCDSIIEIDLQVIEIDNSVTIIDNTLVAVQDDANYQWLNCDDNMLAISGEINQSFSPAADGNYAVQITLDVCTDTSICYEIIGVGVSNLNDFNIKVYPNPTEGKLFVKFPESVKFADIEISNIAGQLVSQIVEFDTDFVEISINQSSGVYFVKICADEYTFNTKIVIK